MVVLHSSGYQTLPCYWLFGPDITNDRFWFAVLAVNFGFVCSERRTGQDFPFSPILFMIFLDRISRYTPRHWRAQIGCFGLAPLLFAQDGTVGLFKPQFPNLTGAIQSRVRSNLDEYLGRWKGHTNESLESPNFCLASRIVWHVLPSFFSIDHLKDSALLMPRGMTWQRPLVAFLMWRTQSYCGVQYLRRKGSISTHATFTTCKANYLIRKFGIIKQMCSLKYFF